MFITKGYPLTIYYQYNICNFTDAKDPINRISKQLEDIFRDDIRIVLDGSHVRYKESFVKDGYTAYALYHLEKDKRVSCLEEESPDNMHPEKKSTKLKIQIKKDTIPYMKDEVLQEMDNKTDFIDIILNIIKDIFHKVTEYKFSEHMEDYEIEFILGNMSQVELLKQSNGYARLRNTYKMRGNPQNTEEDDFYFWDYDDMMAWDALSDDFYKTRKSMIDKLKSKNIEDVLYDEREVNNLEDIHQVNVRSEHIYDIIFQYSFFGEEEGEWGEKCMYKSFTEAIEHCQAVDFLFANTDYENIFFRRISETDCKVGIPEIKEQAERLATEQYVNSKPERVLMLPRYLQKYIQISTPETVHP